MSVTSDYSKARFPITLERFRLLTDHLDLVQEWEMLYLTSNRIEEQDKRKKTLSKMLGLLERDYIKQGKIPLELAKSFTKRYREEWQNLGSRRKENETKQKSYIIGYFAEHVAYHKLQCEGHSVIWMPKGWSDYDLLAFMKGEWLKVQVKSLRYNKSIGLITSNAKRKIECDIVILVDRDGRTFLRKNELAKSWTIGKTSTKFLWADDIPINKQDFLPEGVKFTPTKIINFNETKTI